MGVTVKGAWLFEQTLNQVSTAASTWNLVKIGQVVSEEKLFKSYHEFIHVYSTGAGEVNPNKIKFW